MRGFLLLLWQSLAHGEGANRVTASLSPQTWQPVYSAEDMSLCPTVLLNRERITSMASLLRRLWRWLRLSYQQKRSSAQGTAGSGLQVCVVSVRWATFPIVKRFCYIFARAKTELFLSAFRSNSCISRYQSTYVTFVHGQLNASYFSHDPMKIRKLPAALFTPEDSSSPFVSFSVINSVFYSRNRDRQSACKRREWYYDTLFLFDHRDLQIQKPSANGHISCSDSQSLCRWLCCGAVLRFDGICKADTLLFRVLHQGLTRCMTSCMKKKRRRDLNLFLIGFQKRSKNPPGSNLFQLASPRWSCFRGWSSRTLMSNRSLWRRGLATDGHGVDGRNLPFTPCWCGEWPEYHDCFYF